MPDEAPDSTATPTTTQESSPAADALKNLSSLDAQLAALADDLIAGDFEDEGGTVESVEDIADRSETTAADTDEAIATTDEHESDDDEATPPSDETAATDIDDEDPGDDFLTPEEEAREQADENADEKHAEDAADDPPDAEDDTTEDLASRPPENESGQTEQEEQQETTNRPEESERSEAPAQQPASASPNDETALPQEDDASDGAGNACVTDVDAGSDNDASSRAASRGRLAFFIARTQALARRLAPGVLALCRHLSIPLQGKPRPVRIAVGIVAVWTLALALLTLFVVSRRSVPVPEVHERPPTLDTPDDMTRNSVPSKP